MSRPLGSTKSDSWKSYGVGCTFSPDLRMLQMSTWREAEQRSRYRSHFVGPAQGRYRLPFPRRLARIARFHGKCRQEDQSAIEGD
jgi:hypothetical protein